MRPTRTSTLAVVAVVCALVAWLLLRSIYERLPPLPWTGVPALLIAAAAEAWTGRDLRARIAGRRGLKPAAPLFVSRMVALAKASSLAAAVIAGLAAGFVIYLSGSLNAAIPRQDALTARRDLRGRRGPGLRRALPGVLLPGAEHPGPRPGRRTGPAVLNEPRVAQRTAVLPAAARPTRSADSGRRILGVVSGALYSGHRTAVRYP